MRVRPPVHMRQGRSVVIGVVVLRHIRVEAPVDIAAILCIKCSPIVLQMPGHENLGVILAFRKGDSRFIRLGQKAQTRFVKDVLRPHFGIARMRRGKSIVKTPEKTAARMQYVVTVNTRKFARQIEFGDAVKMVQGRLGRPANIQGSIRGWRHSS